MIQYLAQYQIHSQHKAGKDLTTAAQLLTLCGATWSARPPVKSARFHLEHRPFLQEYKVHTWRGTVQSWCALFRRMDKERASTSQAECPTKEILKEKEDQRKRNSPVRCTNIRIIGNFLPYRCPEKTTSQEAITKTE